MLQQELQVFLYCKMETDTSVHGTMVLNRLRTKTGGTITTSSTLQTAIFPISVQGNIRFEVRKITGTGIRINIDDLSITASGTGGTGGSVLVALMVTI
jgi:hypothetical protein